MGLRMHDEKEQQQGKSKWMWGCCGGCAGVALVAAIGIGVVIYLMVRSRPVVPPETFFQPQSDAFAVMQLRPEHKALTRLLQEYAKNPPAGLDMTAEEKRQLRSQAEQIPKNMEKMTPLQLIILARHLETPTEGAEAEVPQGTEMEAVNAFTTGLGKQKRFNYAAAASIKPYSGFLGWMVSSLIKSFPEQGGRTETYKDVTIGVPQQQRFFLAVMKNNFLFAEEKDIVTGWIDALKGEPKPQKDDEGAIAYSGPERLKSMYERFDRKAPLLFAINNADGEIGDFLTGLREREAKKTEQEGEKSEPSNLLKFVELLSTAGLDSDEVETFGGTFFLSGPDTGVLEFFAECQTPNYASTLSQNLKSGFQEASENENLVIEAEPRGNVAHVVLRMEKLQKTLRQMAERQQKKDGS